MLRLKPRYPVEVTKQPKVLMLHRPSLQALLLSDVYPSIGMSSSCTILWRRKIGRLNGRYLCVEECIALNILNGITRRQSGFDLRTNTLIESRNSGGSREGGPTEASHDCWNSGSSIMTSRKIRSPADNDEFTLKRMDASHG